MTAMSSSFGCGGVWINTGSSGEQRAESREQRAQERERRKTDKRENRVGAKTRGKRG
jgi:hypothetical protein